MYTLEISCYTRHGLTLCIGEHVSSSYVSTCYELVGWLLGEQTNTHFNLTVTFDDIVSCAKALYECSMSRSNLILKINFVDLRYLAHN